MDTEQIAIKLQETTDRSLRNEGRIKKLEGEHAVLHQLATSVAVMAEQMKTMNENVGVLTVKVEDLENKPAKRWEAMVEKIIWAFLAAFVAYILGRMGLGG